MYSVLVCKEFGKYVSSLFKIRDKDIIVDNWRDVGIPLFKLAIFLYAVQKCLCPNLGSESLFPRL